MCVLARFIRIVVVNRSVVLMVVLDTVVVLELMDERCRAGHGRHAATHSEAVEGQAHQHEEIDKLAQDRRSETSGEL